MSGRAWDPQRAEKARRAFDETFSLPTPPEPGEHEELLAIRVAGDRFALRLTELLALHPRRPITPLPGGAPALLGLAGVRGRLVAVYDLAQALGYGPAGTQGRWLACCRVDPGAALSFDDFEGDISVPRARLRPLSRDERHAGIVEQLFEDEAGPRGVLSVPALLAAARGVAHQAGGRRDG